MTGNTPSVTPGEFVDAAGVWFNDHKHGIQFRVKHIKTVTPNTLEGIEKYLGSGMVKGIGPHFAKRLVKAFGEQVCARSFVLSPVARVWEKLPWSTVS